MHSSSLPPEEQPRVKPFDPLVLDRTVIAVPLLKEMHEDLDLIVVIRKTRPNLTEEFNSAVEFNGMFPGGAKGARERFIEMVERAGKEALETATHRLRTALESTKEREQKRHDALKKAVANQTVGPLEPAGYSFARLHAAVIRRFLAANERLASPYGMSAQPIDRIHPRRFDVIIDLNLEHPGGREAARNWVLKNLETAKEEAGVQDAGQEVHLEKDQHNSQYLFARLEARAIQKLVKLDMAAAKTEAKKRDGHAEPRRFRAIFHIWPDFEISGCMNKSVSTLKVDVAWTSFLASGAGITWGVMDSGIDNKHPHFAEHKNLELPSPWHKDFTVDGGGPFDDKNGHGTHVAGVIAGEWRVPPGAPKKVRRPVAVSRYLTESSEDIEYEQTSLDAISGMAPKCKLVSLRVLDENGKGAVSNLIAAIGHVQEINGYGRRLVIHGVMIGASHNFEPEWGACGQSPLCAEVDRLVKTGVVVVVAAGNTGYSTLKSAAGATSAGMALTINDPGNSDLAITVGSTHRDMPHVYGISYFSSKGPTADGRQKPDLVAPGENITSCATGYLREVGAREWKCDYVSTSGTSVAAAHVAGSIAAFLSARTEFIGRPGDTKRVFMMTAEDLKRFRTFQGCGLIDLFAALQMVSQRGKPLLNAPIIPPSQPLQDEPLVIEAAGEDRNL